MDVKIVVCLFTCLCVSGVFGQVSSLCRPNERLLDCGCPKTCKDPVPECKGVCKTGCFCEEGQVRNEKGFCVDLADCPRLSEPYKLDTSEPRYQGGLCPENEEYRPCEPCIRTCDNPNPVCPAQCARGCFCKGNLLRDKDGRCVEYENCSNVLEYIREREKNYVEPVARYSCGKKKVYKECQKCTPTCSKPGGECADTCKSGCFCKDGLVKGPDGNCIRKEECPKAVLFDGVLDTSIEDCSSNEEYFSCGWCEPTCQDPAPRCPDGCTRGCLCKPPLLRHSSGLCVPQDRCVPRKCKDPNEKFRCSYGCERRCGNTTCPLLQRSRRCDLGCHCKGDLLRDHRDRCVTEEECFRDTIVVL